MTNAQKTRAHPSTNTFANGRHTATLLATNILRVFRHGAPEAAAARLRPRPQQSRRGHGGWSRPPVQSDARGATPVRVESAKQRANTPTYPCDTPLRALQ